MRGWSVGRQLHVGLGKEERAPGVLCFSFISKRILPPHATKLQRSRMRVTITLSLT
jgi:hypothetical protein